MRYSAVYDEDLLYTATSNEADTEEKDEPFANKVYIIIPEKCSGELSGKARELANAIIEKTEVLTVVKYDNEAISIGENDITVLLGNTDYLVSQEAVKPLRYGDYLCKWDDSSIILGGRHDDDTIKAVDKFLNEFIHGASSQSLMSENAGFEHINEYSFSSVTLNGFDLYDYTLVYPEGNFGGERRYAETLQAYILKKSGYLLDLISDNEVDDSTGKIISFKKKTKMVGASVEVVDNNIYVRAAADYEFSIITADIAQKLFSQDSADLAVEIPTYVCLREGTLVKVGYAFTPTSEGASLNFISDWAELLRETDLDVILLDKISPWFEDYFLTEKEKYGIIELKDKDGNMYPIMYKRGAFEEISADISEFAVTLEIKCESEYETRRIICPLTADAEKLDDMIKASGRYDTFLIKNKAPVISALYEISVIDDKGWFSGGKNNKCFLIANDVFDVENNEMTVNAISYANVILSFSYRLNSCKEFENLENSIK